ncbi:telomere repeat-binding protein 2 [Humulus lupulus]|uniref:telomere repeat-binding protein 2 n=1 Tax=Humulus lupulus TaxID=3486 RepID=UPI002B417448|nr:telomere repeat-binding protein 2 [Humulus lupulus]
MDKEGHYRKKFPNMKSQRVKAEESFAPALEDETVEHLLAEPKIENVSVDGVLHFGEENAEKCFGFDDEFSRYEYFSDTYRGGLHSNTAQQGEDELEFGVLDGLLDEVEEIEDLHAADGLASPSEDFLLDIGFPGKVCGMDYGPPCWGSLTRNVSSASPSPGFSGSSNSPVGISESSSVTIQESECKNDSLNKPENHELPALRYRRRREKPVSLEFRNPSLSDDDDDPLLSSMLINKHGRKSGDASKIGASRREKRLRKPTQRYIEEFSNKKSKHLKGQGKFSAVSAAGMKNKQLKVKSPNELHIVRSGTLSSVPEEEFPGETKIPVVPEVRARRGRPKKQISVLVTKPKEEVFTSDSDDDRVKKRKRSEKHDRRKHQRMWTITEVTKLVDGISEYGVGRWTDIKRFLFTTSAYRTPIDLRDKWRNLLRASSVQKLKKKEAEENQLHALRPLPKSLIRRVRELAKIHPYPRERGQKS